MTVSNILGGNIVGKIIVMQAVVAVLVLCLMKILLGRELFMAALEKLSVMPFGNGHVDEVIVVTAGKISAKEEAALRAVILQRLPRSRLVLGCDACLGGGLLIRVGEHVLDFSFWTKIKQLAGVVNI